MHNTVFYVMWGNAPTGSEITRAKLEFYAAFRQAQCTALKSKGLV